MRTVLFKQASLSTNANSFGLRGLILVSRSGRAFEIGVNYLSVAAIEESGGKVRLPVDRRGDVRTTPSFSFEIPRKLPRAPRPIVRELFQVPA